MNSLKEHFNKEASQFDNQVKNTMPNYNEMLAALINSIPKTKNNPKILDLGCGTGNITRKVKKEFPEAEVTCFDLSENMIKIAKDKLQNFDNIEFIIGDFVKYDIENKYDAIISSLALHHLKTDNDKQDMYQKIFNALNNNGVFYNADVTKANSIYNQKLNQKMAEEYMMHHEVTEKEIKEYQQKKDDNDHPVTLIKYLKLLSNVGFSEIDVIWKYYGSCVYGGTKKE